MRISRASVALVAVASLGVAGVGLGSAAAGGGPQPPIIQDKSSVEVQILALNDFHGNLQPPAGSSGRVGTDHAGWRCRVPGDAREGARADEPQLDRGVGR